MSTVRRLLLSQNMLDRLGPDILQRASGQPLELVSIESAVRHQRRDIDAAFISREVTGNSTKHEVHPELQACYDLLASECRLTSLFGIAKGDLPPTHEPQAVMRLLSAPVLGIAAMRLSNRLGPNEDADALARTALDLVLAGHVDRIQVRGTGPAGNVVFAVAAVSE